ncbi:hypothetical protein BDV93DRAFT_516122 [Ceratobasidium sp. AG-I]|nr:hypothetical protein BDV93DRAFT_516122 [Ceratobasidium sp. AG-I]
MSKLEPGVRLQNSKLNLKFSGVLLRLFKYFLLVVVGMPSRSPARMFWASLPFDHDSYISIEETETYAVVLPQDTYYMRYSCPNWFTAQHLGVAATVENIDVLETVVEPSEEKDTKKVPVVGRSRKDRVQLTTKELFAAVKAKHFELAPWEMNDNRGIGICRFVDVPAELQSNPVISPVCDNKCRISDMEGVGGGWLHRQELSIHNYRMGMHDLGAPRTACSPLSTIGDGLRSQRYQSYGRHNRESSDHPNTFTVAQFVASCVAGQLRMIFLV